MRLKNLILGEFYLVHKYGIAFLYLIFTILYISFLSVIPDSAKQITASILIFSDPAAMGLFFMGAMVLFEKSQRVESSLGISPITVSEYIIAKIIPFMIIGTVVALFICCFSFPSKLLLALIGVVLSSMLFSMCGLFVGSNIKTLNGFMIATIPFEVFLFLPGILFSVGVLHSPLWIIHPGVAAIRLINGDSQYWYFSILSLVLSLIPIFFACKKGVTRSFLSMDGIKI